jgi:hypothetical protein
VIVLLICFRVIVLLIYFTLHLAKFFHSLYFLIFLLNNAFLKHRKQFLIHSCFINFFDHYRFTIPLLFFLSFI